MTDEFTWSEVETELAQLKALGYEPTSLTTRGMVGDDERTVSISISRNTDKNE